MKRFCFILIPFLLGAVAVPDALYPPGIKLPRKSLLSPKDAANLSGKPMVRASTVPRVSLPPPRLALTWTWETNRLWRVYLTDDFTHWSFLAEVYTNRCPIPSDNPFLFFTVISVDPISGLTSNPEPLP